MKKTALLLGVFFFSTFFLKAQNLVPNPGFELFSKCPTGIAQFRLAKYWFSGNTGTPEYLRLKCEYNVGKPHSGKGYAGAIFFGQYPKAIEYLMIQLYDTLEKDSAYCLGFWVRAEESFVYIDQLGLHLSKENLRLGMWAPINLKPTLNSEYGVPITPQLDWLWIGGEYIAEGGEGYLSIGNFVKPDRHIQYVDEFYGSFERGWNSYYYIDDVEVRLKSNEIGCRPKSTVELIAEAEQLKPRVKNFNIFFDSDQFIPNQKEHDYLMVVLDTLEGYTIDFIELIGHTDSIGSLEYNLDLSKKRIMQIRELTVAKLSTRPSFKLNYFGELKPTTLNNSDKGRSKNRRVEVKVIYHDRKRE